MSFCDAILRGIGFTLLCRAEFQCATTKDFATDSWFWTVFTGVLNHQTVHHLFPGIIQSHYPKIRPIIAETCKEFGVRYNQTDEGLYTFHTDGTYLGDMQLYDLREEMINSCTVWWSE